MEQRPFWRTKSLNEMTQDEWESLCDGCGICCLQKIEDQETGRIKLTSVSCQFLDPVDCHCMVYDDRLIVNPDCIELLPGKIMQMTWLPSTCAYRRLSEGRELESWHPLVSGDPGTVHQAGISVRDKTLSGRYVHPKDILGACEMIKE